MAETQRRSSGALADAKIWRNLHGRGTERAATWLAKYESKCAEPTVRKLAEAERAVGQQRQRIADLECRIEVLEQEKAGLEQRNRDWLANDDWNGRRCSARCLWPER